ncbi:arginyl-tRNA synthetase [Anseongella ginsenosidimutans]|uniref:Arginine--tRNA ligase n=1 Tax=Anseongella ginsenosidimutans TaxID=496056 RepID=A0A4R3KU66_9SPHI|nr:arginine--tRNA ligase [Anseongella ginsenosidimutans]QEC52947.1 arginine--tRNA ligase [Anseongella ginsenosidimutans]TCS87345.1 arginyl-tRNA synthetase [Anseongella ginsenosidimutans]
MTITEFVAGITAETIAKLYQETIPASSVTLNETRKEFEGDLTVVTFPFTRFSKKSPEETARELGNYLQENYEEVARFNVVKGFLNLVISDRYWLERVKEMALSENYGAHSRNGQKVMVEYSSPNTNKPLHLGHVRNNLLGYSVSRILDAAGYDVIKSNLINDRGIHICKSMLAWLRFGDGESPATAGMKGDHFVGKFYVLFEKKFKEQVKGLMEVGMTEEEAKYASPLMREAQEMLRQWEEGEKEVVDFWKIMNGWVYEGFDVTYKKLGVDFDKIYYESDTYLLGKDIVNEGLEKGVFFRKPDGSVWIDLSGDGLDEKLLLRADGTSVYITQDLGTAQLKYDDYGMEKSIYVVGNEQDYHFKVLFLILEKLGKPWAGGLHHLSYGMVDLPSGKMKSREGTVVDADDLMVEMIDKARQNTLELGKANELPEAEKEELFRKVGMGALKYFLLRVDPKKRLLFDPNESIDMQGHTGPFIQYTYARIRSVLEKAGKREAAFNLEGLSLNADEKNLVILLNKFGEIIAEAAAEYNPAIVANYLYDLGKTFNKFYHDNSILKAEDPQLQQFRLGLSVITAGIISRGMALLGIDVPDQM